jgi:hypothetical protein
MTMKDRRATQKAILERMMQALSGEDELLITEAGAADRVPIPTPPQTTRPQPTAQQQLFAEVHYALDLFPDVVDEDLERAIVETVARLPEPVRDYVCYECRFLSVGYPRVLKGDPRRPWAILLPSEIPADDVHSLIARQIALIWLQHRHPARPGTLGLYLAAAKLTRRWGFEGQGADVEEAQQLVDEHGAATWFGGLW